jgi:hypothetical protein
MTDAEVFKEWARRTFAGMQAQVRMDSEAKTASDAVAGMPPVPPATEM